MVSRTGTALAVAAAFTLVLAFSIPSQAGGTSFTGRNQAWHPHTLTVAHGTRVTWSAADTTHTVTAYRGDWSKDTTIHSGDSTGFTFRDAGRFKFRCTIHSTLSGGVCSGMCGKVVVT